MTVRALARVNVAAIERNVARLAAAAAPARLCAVVKADGYGHGAVAVGRAALGGGAHALAVALVEEGVQLRDAGVDWRMYLFGGAQHSFTHPFVDGSALPGLAYHRPTDERSWRAMLDLFAETIDI